MIASLSHHASIDTVAWRNPQSPEFRAFDRTLNEANDNRMSDLKDAAAALVSSALLQPAMQSLTESPLRPQSGPFAASSVERRFMPLLHAEIADRVVNAANFGLVDQIVNRFTQSKTTTMEIVA